MVNWTVSRHPDEGYESLLNDGYVIENARISNVNLSMEEHGFLALYITLEGSGWACVYGGYALGEGYLGATEFKGSAIGMESIMRIMDVVGVKRFNDMNGKIIRVAYKNWGDALRIIGNVLEDKWFDIESFFKDKHLGSGYSKAGRK